MVFINQPAAVINFAGTNRNEMEPEFAAKSGIARTFQNIALFKGMSTLDNLMTGRLLKQKQNFLMQALYFGPVEKEEAEHREKSRESNRLFRPPIYQKNPCGLIALRITKKS